MDAWVYTRNVGFLQYMQINSMIHYDNIFERLYLIGTEKAFI